MNTTAAPASPPSTLQFQSLVLHKAISALKAVNHKLRLSMLQLIHANGSLTVSSLYQQMRLDQSVASQHLAILRQHDFVQTRREGKFVYYSVNYERLKETESLCRQLLHKKMTVADLLREQELL